MEAATEGSASAQSPLSAQEQARIRRERRQAKFREGGNSRLNRITATQGTTDFRKEDLDSSLPPSKPPQASDSDDPPETDILGQFRTRPSALQAHQAAHFSPATLPEDELRQAMMMDQLFRPRGVDSPDGAPGGQETEQDPLMQLLQQISGAGGAGGGFPGMQGIPPGMESMMSGMMGGMGGGKEQRQGDRWMVWWMVVHALGALLLSFWVLKGNEVVFDGTEMSRTESANLAPGRKPQLFWYFAMMELMLQSGRFLVEQGRPPQGSTFTTVASFLPPPFSTYLGTLARYSVFLWAILADASVVIFALGIASWWNS